MPTSHESLIRKHALPPVTSKILKIGRGGFSSVYRYGSVAVKVMEDVDMGDWKREAQICKSMGRRGVGPRVYHVARTEDRTCLIYMEYLAKEEDPDGKAALRNLRAVANMGLFLVDLKPSCIRGSRLIDFTSDWVNYFPKTCDCCYDVVWPRMCLCHASLRKEVSFYVMQVIMVTMGIVYDKYLGVCDVLWENLRKTSKDVMDVAENAFKYDDDVKTILVHYMYSELSKEKKEQIEKSDHIYHWYKHLTNVIRDRKLLPDIEILKV